MEIDWTQRQKSRAETQVRVLVVKGKREGQKGWIRNEHRDGTIEVAFTLDQGGGSESQHLLPEQIHTLGAFVPCPVRGIGHNHLADECSHYRDCLGCGYCCQ